MKLSELQETIADLIDTLPETADMRVCFFDSASQLSHSLWTPELHYLEKDTGYGDECLYESIEDLDANGIDISDVELIVTL